MIGYLKGTIIAVEQANLVVDVNQVGYVVYCGEQYCQNGQIQIGDEVQLYIETIMRENMLVLYGFQSLAGKEFFQILCKVQGVGAKMAMALLTYFSLQDLQKMILAKDSVSLSKAPGIGAKLAQRIVNELCDKLPKLLNMTDKDRLDSMAASESTEFENALAALIQLGYARHQAYEALMNISRTSNSTSDDLQADMLIKQALQILGKTR